MYLLYIIIVILFKITQPMQQNIQEHPIPPQMIIGTPQINHHNSNLIQSMQSLNLNNADPNGVIMVDTMSINKQSQQSNSISNTSTDSKNQKKSKKNKKKSKNNERNDSKGNNINDRHTQAQLQQQHQQQQQQLHQPKMVTLRNPMFHAVSSAIRQNPVPAGNSATVPSNGMDQPAAIIKNENGMFTIRNPALHQAMQSGHANNQYRQYNPNVYNPNDHAQNFSYFSDMASGGSNLEGSSINIGDIPTQKKSCSAIGSEMKSAQQQKQQQQKLMSWTDAQQNSDLFNHHLNNYNENIHRQSPFENQCVYGLNNSNFIMPSTSPGLPTLNTNTIPTASRHQPQPATSSSFYDSLSNNGGANFGSYLHNSDCNSLFSNNICSETNSSSSSTPSTTQQHQFYDGCNGGVPQSSVPSMGAGTSQHKYDDLSFLQNLQPGHRLNSEVSCFY